MSGEIFRKCLNPIQTNSLDNWLCPQPRLASKAKRKPSILYFGKQDLHSLWTFDETESFLSLATAFKCLESISIYVERKYILSFTLPSLTAATSHLCLNQKLGEWCQCTESEYPQ